MKKCLVVGLALTALLLSNAGYAEFDRDSCYGKCRGAPLRFGQLPEAVRLNHLAQGNYDACIQECDRQFWAEFDKTANTAKEKDK